MKPLSWNNILLKSSMNLLLKLNKDSNTTLIIITHDPRVAAQAQRTISIRDGMVERNIQ